MTSQQFGANAGQRRSEVITPVGLAVDGARLVIGKWVSTVDAATIEACCSSCLREHILIGPEEGPDVSGEPARERGLAN